MKSFDIIRSFMKPYWKSIAVGSCFLVISNLLHVFLPSFIGQAIDLLGKGFSYGALYRICVIIIVLEALKSIAQFFMRYSIIGASWNIENDIRKNVFRHLLHLPPAYFTKMRTGDIIARITNDLTAARMMFGPAVMYSMNVIVLVPLAVVFMFSKDAELTLYSLFPLPFIALMMNILGRKIHKNFITVQESYSDISAHVQENFNGIGVIKAFVRERSELTKLWKLSRTYVDNNCLVIRLQSIMFPLLNMLVSSSIILLLWLGGRKVAMGGTTIGVLVSLIMYIGLLVWPSIALGWVIAIFQRGIASMHRIQEILSEETEPGDGGEVHERLIGAITVRDLNFSYNGDYDVLKNVSFTVKPGMTVAVTGRTGSGKSTLLDILSGNYRVPRGMVFMDGVDVNDLQLSQLRSSIALVPQETFLFSETVAENIAFGNEHADDEAVRRSAALAAVADEIESFPDRYETLLGERGVTVSGGQRQRIAIARALISDTPMVFFDDSLSHVDTKMEKIILRNLKEVVKGKTALIVTQRLDAVRDADNILYMKDGCILEHGTHEELMNENGEYAALYREQKSIEALEEQDIR